MFLNHIGLIKYKKNVFVFMRNQFDRRSFVLLDCLRGVAALLVVQFHMRSQFMGYAGFPAGGGYLAVDLFFSLSGFVIAHAYLQKFRQGMTVKQFIKIRIIRLYPLYLLGLIVGGGLLAIYLYKNGKLFNSNFFSVIVLEAFFLPARLVGTDQLFPINNVAWSLFFELIINIFFALTWKKLNSRALLLLIAITGLMLSKYALDHHSASVGNTWDTIAGGGLRSSFSFFIGLLIYDKYKSGKMRFNVSYRLFIFSILILVVALVTPVPFQFRSYFDLFFIMILSPLLILIAINAPVKSNIDRIYCFLGDSSYSIYCLHYPISMGIVLISKLILGGAFELLITTISIVLFLIASFFLNNYYDVPLRRLIGSKISS